ncbi:hypothetical protein PYCCODRAFT_1471507 [Trametes coccinea BRFM310]|uniref:Uncharacterized protein n=1 Tax=Trametes coccinea (strain BRFM310) TaxID=1353009 RepID=A0A1Y2I9R7_TRAC3|nr:hypothetical protein PYCCODRAFT_1471507 [Trametes coccinea BRFM310]
MPELDILHGFQYLTLKLKKKWGKHHCDSMRARLALFPRVFATGTKQKDYVTCSVDARSVFDYHEDLEPVEASYEPNRFDAAKARGKSYARYLKPLSDGELVVKARGKEIIFAAGYHAIRVHFGLEGTMVIMPTQAFRTMIAHDCPGSNKDPKKAAQMRSFVVPQELVVDGARNLEGRQQTMAVFAALVGEEHTLLWKHIWSNNHGPDWIDEKTMAEVTLDVWRAGVLETLKDMVTASAAKVSLLDALCSRQDVFNGYGQHTSHGLLHVLGLWPGMPASELCADEGMFNRFKMCLHTYAAQYTSNTYRRRCLSLPNRQSPLEYNYKSDDNYHKLYLRVFRKSLVRMTREEYNRFARLGLFNSDHVIGEPYQVNENDLIDVAYKDVPVYQYLQSHKSKEPIYTAIVARPPSHWKYSSGDVQKTIAPDARNAGFATTIGPASFHMYKNNQHHWDVKAKPGRKAKIHTGKAGRPPRASPLANALRQRAGRGQSAVARATVARSIMEQDQDHKIAEEEALDSQRPSKRRRTSKLSVGKTDRVTRSDGRSDVKGHLQC